MQYRLALIAMLFWVMPLCHAEVYKWVDENGRVHFSDTPRDGVQQGIPVKSHTPEQKKTQQEIEQQRREKTNKLLHALGEERRIKREKEAKAKQERQQRERECNSMRNDLADMERGGVVYYDLKENGKRDYWSDDKLKRRISELRETIANRCS